MRGRGQKERLIREKGKKKMKTSGLRFLFFFFFDKQQNNSNMKLESVLPFPACICLPVEETSESAEGSPFLPLNVKFLG